VRAGHRRLLVWGALLAALAAALGYAFRPQPVAVDLATVTRSLFRVTVDEEGETRVRDVYTVSAPVAGRLLRIEAEAGDLVVAGETLLARIEPAAPAFLDVRVEAEARAAVAAASAARDFAAADLERAKAELAFAESELKRAEDLILRGTIAQRALDEARRAHRTASASLATATAALSMREHELEQAEARLLARGEVARIGEACECVPITAPMTGTVLRVLRRSEGVVESGTPLIELGDPRDLEVVASLLSEDAVQVQAGQTAIVTGWGGAALAAVVRRVEPYGYTEISALGIEEQRVDVVLDFTDPPDRRERLGHGFRVEVAVVLHEAEALTLPLGALFRSGEDWAAFAVRDGKARLAPLVVGRRNGLSVEILGGLAEGEEVVLYPSDRVADGVGVVPRRPG
jgi:HlyD family secretion protein